MALYQLSQDGMVDMTTYYFSTTDNNESIIPLRSSSLPSAPLRWGPLRQRRS